MNNISMYAGLYRDDTVEYFDLKPFYIHVVFVKMLNESTCWFNPALFPLWLEAPQYSAQTSQDISQVENIKKDMLNS